MKTNFDSISKFQATIFSVDLGKSLSTYEIDCKKYPLTTKDMEVLTMANYFIESKCWIIDVANRFEYSYTTVWRKLHLKLAEICPDLHEKVLKRIEENKIMRGIYNLDSYRKKNSKNYGKFRKIWREN